MKNNVKDIYFNGADDKNLEEFTERFLSKGLFWLYIAINEKKGWGNIYRRLSKHKRFLFKNEYNKAFLFTKTYRELTRLFLGKDIILKNLFLPKEAEKWPERFVKYNRVDESRWKEVLELIA